MNYPVFVLSNGNPVASGYFWVVLGILFLISVYYFSKKLFDQNTAYFALAFVSSELVTHVWGMFHPDMAMFLTIPYFYFFYLYYRTGKLKYLLSYLFLAGLVFQFEVAPGLSFLILSFIISVLLIIKKKNYLHIFSFLILLIPLSSFILFDLRHNFIQFRSVIMFGFGSAAEHRQTFTSMLHQRIYLAFIGGLNLFKNSFKTIEFYFGKNWEVLNVFPLILFTYHFLRSVHRKEKESGIYILFVIFYLGFYALTLLRNGNLLYFHWYALIPLIYLIFASLSRYKNPAFFLLSIIILGLSLYQNLQAVVYVKGFIPTSEDSWKFEKELGDEVFKMGGKNFGYLVFTPDVYAYEPKYGIVYAQRNHPSQTSYLGDKKQVTIVVLAPDDPRVTRAWWMKTKMSISSKPQGVYNFPNGYTVERFIFPKDQQGMISDPVYTDPLYFR